MNKLLKYIETEGLVSYMNKTKWTELISGIKSKEIEMPVRHKYVRNDEIHISVLDITLISHDGASDIEWIDFRLKNEINGEDYSSRTISFLKQCNIPYSVQDQHIRVYGYVRPGNKDEIV